MIQVKDFSTLWNTEAVVQPVVPKLRTPMMIGMLFHIYKAAAPESPRHVVIPLSPAQNIWLGKNSPTS